jgi:hypothetical protein
VDQNHSEIATGICEILMPSFFPISNPSDAAASRQSTSNDHVQRCLQLIENNFLAAEVFYRNIINFAPIGSVAKLSVILFQLVNTNLEGISSDGTVEKSKGKRKRDQKVQLLEIHFDLILILILMPNFILIFFCSLIVGKANGGGNLQCSPRR